MFALEHADELRLVERRADRRKALFVVDRRLRSRHRWASRVSFYGALSVGNVLAAILSDTALSGTHIPGLLVHLGTAALVGIALWFVLWLHRRDAQHELRLYLRELGIPICLHCGYDLRGQTVPRCPECGRAFEPAILQVSAAEDPPARR